MIGRCTTHNTPTRRIGRFGHDDPCVAAMALRMGRRRIAVGGSDEPNPVKAGGSRCNSRSEGDAQGGERPGSIWHCRWFAAGCALQIRLLVFALQEADASRSSEVTRLHI